ncbi:hypothetical protein KC19_8G131800 [Ceratodon purpureus]|uniref:Uncharacterized protein n=1 Tax=Ceratodon purpureus TaxID=3225 RepID=A0A8T0H1U2_CERPU|nr:hypothetical protein KC19_8G131800 [Ceratodon purpureus]
MASNVIISEVLNRSNEFLLLNRLTPLAQENLQTPANVHCCNSICELEQGCRQCRPPALPVRVSARLPFILPRATDRCARHSSCAAYSSNSHQARTHPEQQPRPREPKFSCVRSGE